MIKQQLLQLKMKFELVHENCYLVGGGMNLRWEESTGENFFSGSRGWVSKFSATGETPHSSSGQKSTLYGYLINYLILSSKMAAF